MFLKIITEADLVRKYRNLFVRRLKTLMVEKLQVRLGHLGASTASQVIWSDNLGIWMAHEKGKASPYNHAFGIGKPLPGSFLAASCEINFPVGGIDRRIGGAFARDRRGQIFVVHRGKIGGGRKGIGKSLFDSHYRGVWALMDDGDQETVVAVIGLLKSERFPRQLAHFVHKIGHIKAEANTASPQTMLSFAEVSFREEWTGNRQGDFFRDMAGLCDQGIVIRDLYHTLKTAGFRVGNDPFRDLFLVDNQDRIRAIFHVKTDTLPISLQEGVTQLLLQSLNIPHRTRLFLALPAPPEAELWRRLSKMNVDPLIYTWRGEKAIFPDLVSQLHRETIPTKTEHKENE